MRGISGDASGLGHSHFAKARAFPLREGSGKLGLGQTRFELNWTLRGGPLQGGPLQGGLARS